MIYQGQVMILQKHKKTGSSFSCKHKCKNPKNSSTMNQATYKNNKIESASENARLV